MRVIDADELLDVFEDLDERTGRTPWMLKDIVDVVDEQPEIEAAPVVHGRWNKCDQGGFSIKGFMACSVCDVMIPDTGNNHYCMEYLHYCPKCGAKMDLEE